MAFFRLIGLLTMLFVQSAIPLAEVTELDVLESPSHSDVKKEAPLPLTHSSQTSSDKSDTEFQFIDTATTRVSTNAYLLDAGDTVEIRVFGQEDLNLKTRLDSSGVINYPFLGKIPAVKMTTSDLERLIASGLKDGYLRSPQVHISIAEYRPFYIKGQVVNPGAYSYQPGLTLVKAVTLAGGYTELASENDIFIVYEKDPKKHAVRIASNGSVHPGDSITVNESLFYIDGEVTNPGKYPLRSGLTVREAISLAGGLTERASTRKIYMKTGKGSLANIQLDSEVRSGDSIIIEQSFF